MKSYVSRRRRFKLPVKRLRMISVTITLNKWLLNHLTNGIKKVKMLLRNQQLNQPKNMVLTFTCKANLTIMKNGWLKNSWSIKNWVTRRQFEMWWQVYHYFHSTSHYCLATLNLIIMQKLLRISETNVHRNLGMRNLRLHYTHSKWNITQRAQ